MAKKTNKTDHVLSLLTNAGVGEDSLQKIRTNKDMPAPESPPQFASTTKSPHQLEKAIEESLRAEQEQSELAGSEAAAEQIVKEAPAEQTAEENLGSAAPESLAQADQTPADPALLKPKQETQAVTNENPEEKIFHLNIAEEVVATKAKEMIKTMGVCKCNRCYNDIIALALNHLPTHYVVTSKGILLAQLATYEIQNSIDILTAVTRSCITVKANPSHPKSEKA